MQEAPTTIDEAQRIAKLESYNILDTLPEDVYNDIVQLASSVCETPIALVSLVDQNRQWFKAKVGLGPSATPRSVAFCAHAIQNDHIFEIPDSTKDDRFHDNPLVTGAPNVIFYAGAPIITPEGHNVGTLCVIDNKPNLLNSRQKDMLSRLSKQVAYILEQRIISNKLETLNKKLQSANDELEQFSYRASHDLKSPLVAIQRLSEFILEDIGSSQLDDATTNVKRVLEQAHRLETTVIDILSLNTAGTLVEIDTENFDFGHLVQTAKENVRWAFEDSNCELKVELNFDGQLNGQKIRYQQIIENLLTNGAKYRDPKKAECFVSIRSFVDKKSLTLEIEDNGIGIPKKYHKDVMKMFKRFHPHVSSGSGLGLAIVKKHAEALQGSIDFRSSEQGTLFILKFPLI